MHSSKSLNSQYVDYFPHDFPNPPEKISNSLDFPDKWVISLYEDHGRIRFKSPLYLDNRPFNDFGLFLNIFLEESPDIRIFWLFHDLYLFEIS